MDSAGKPGSGIMTGNMIMMGNYDQCQSLKNASANYYDYCTVKAQALLGGVSELFGLIHTKYYSKLMVFYVTN